MLRIAAELPPPPRPRLVADDLDAGVHHRLQARHVHVGDAQVADGARRLRVGKVEHCVHVAALLLLGGRGAAACVGGRGVQGKRRRACPAQGSNPCRKVGEAARTGAPRTSRGSTAAGRSPSRPAAGATGRPPCGWSRRSCRSSRTAGRGTAWWPPRSPGPRAPDPPAGSGRCTARHRRSGPPRQRRSPRRPQRRQSRQRRQRRRCGRWCGRRGGRRLREGQRENKM
jgi:hypothetical protein